MMAAVRYVASGPGLNELSDGLIFVGKSVHDHTGVPCLVLLLFPCKCQSVVEHILFHVAVCTVLLPILAVLI